MANQPHTDDASPAEPSRAEPDPADPSLIDASPADPDPADPSLTDASPAEPGAAQPALSDDERAERLAQLRALVELMRPAVQSDGGDLVLVSADVEAGVVEVQLQGACSSCAISSATLQGGVERILMDRLPWVTEVVGGLTEEMDLYESAAMGQGAYVPRF